MGMDVYGTNGAYFRANIWGWHAILFHCQEAGFDVPPDWGENVGAGLESQEQCDALAELLQGYVEDSLAERFDKPSENIAVDESGAFVSVGSPGARSPYCTTRDQLWEFIDFLRNCGGGFEIC